MRFGFSWLRGLPSRRTLRAGCDFLDWLGISRPNPDFSIACAPHGREGSFRRFAVAHETPERRPTALKKDAPALHMPVSLSEVLIFRNVFSPQPLRLKPERSARLQPAEDSIRERKVWSQYKPGIARKPAYTKYHSSIDHSRSVKEFDVAIII